MHGNHQRTSSRPVGANVHAPAQVSHDLGVSNWTVQSHTAQGPHQGDASRDSHRSATRGHCQCAAECCRGSLGHAGVTPAARGLRLGHAGVTPTARGLSLGHAGVTPAARRLRLGHAGVIPTARGLRLGHAGVTPAARGLRLGHAGVTLAARGPPRTRAPPTTSIVSARTVKRWGPPLNVWSRFASFPRCASRLH